MDENHSIHSSPSALVLSNAERDRLLGFNQPLPKIMSAEVSPLVHTDKIGTFNIQNKFAYSTAAELMVGENFSFLALQEPHGTQHTSNASWQAYNKCELQSARIDCFESQYQVILVDTWKWGGKTVSDIGVYLQGRIISMAFEFGDGAQLGIISVYASSAETHHQNKSEINDDIIAIYDDITDKWKDTFPNMNIMIMGDLQETCSTSDRDNLGTFRKEKNLQGILAHLEDTHESFIRAVNDKDQYLTRFGQVGARGLDHIMISQDPNAQKKFSSPKICRHEGHSYFASDHSLLVCEYRRNDANNNEDGHSTTKIRYSPISSIKMKSSGERGETIEFNDNQFKGSERFKEQKKLYNKVQELTHNAAHITTARLPEIESRVDALIHKLWQDGVKQKVSGLRNKLVRIKEDQAVELAYTYEKFQHAIKEVMEELELSSTKNDLERAGKTRGQLRKRSGFKMFRNLPIPTKLRYLRMAIRNKINLIKKAQLWIKEAKIKLLNSNERLEEEQFWRIRDELVQTCAIQKKAESICQDMITDDAERQAHMEAVRFESLNKNSKARKAQEMKEHNIEKNQYDDKESVPIPNISDSMMLLLNSWLLDSGCNHGFSRRRKHDALENLSHTIVDWKIPMTNFIDPPSFYEDESLWNTVSASLDNCETLLQKVLTQVIRTQVKYRSDTLHYFLHVNSISSFTHKVLFKLRSAPATHTIIWDASQNMYRKCTNEIEELQATQNFHSHWMSDSKATENCAFARIVEDGKLGARGVTLMPDRKIQMEDIDKLIHNGSKLPRRIKRAFIRAHKKFTANLFRAPQRSRKEFNYPFFLTDDKGGMHLEDVMERKLWKSLASIPTKARHDGAHIAVLGRFGIRWRLLLAKFIKLMLVMRYIPAEMKKISRYPIPKPGKINEYRPISLCNDLYCFLNGLITGITSEAIEKIKLLHEGITSYRRGKSCATLVAIEQCFREDCVEGNQPTVQIDEDEEKFFDRVCLEIILAVMKINGFPSEGFIEMKACMMSTKLVEIITAKGTAYAIFQCGLEQGNPDSPTIANLVIKLKHDIWRSLSKEAKKIFESDDKGQCDSYKFYTCDRDDISILLYMIGYCDDNTKFITAANENNLIFLVQYYIQLSGDLSMTTKIGRKSSKCDVQFFNVSAEFAIKLEKCWSTAWSFLHDKPIEEQVPFKVFLQTNELERFFSLIKYNELTLDEQQKWMKIVQPKAHRHLGLSATLRGDTSLSSSTTIAKMHDRLTQLKLRYMETAAQRKCVNMLINSMHSYVPIQSNYDPQELQRLDASIVNIIKSRNGMSNSDCKHRTFLPQKYGGLGIISVLETDIVSVARELEIATNGDGLDSRTIRGRAAAIFTYKDTSAEDIYNHVLQAIRKLGRYGIFLRDKRDEMINNVLEELAQINGQMSVGHEKYTGGNGPYLGFGKESLLKYSFGGQLHNLLLHLQDCNWKADKVTHESCIKYGFNITSILSARKKTGTNQYDQIDNAFSFFEWNNLNNSPFSNKIQVNPTAWTHKRPNHSARLQSKNKWEWTYQQLIQSAMQLHHIDWEHQIITNEVEGDCVRTVNSHSSYGRILNFILQRGSPIIVATDGAHTNEQANIINPQKALEWNTSSAIVVCSLDIRVNESLESMQWAHRPMIPLLCRTTVTPAEIGASKSDIAHGECFAVVMEELMLDPDIPRIVIMDSEAVRNQICNIRDNDTDSIDRMYVREHAGGVSKFFAGILRNSFGGMVATEGMSEAKRWLINILQLRNETFLNVTERWIAREDTIVETNSVGWRRDYFDGNVQRSVLKVNSHQLETCGTKIKSPSRYATLTPNLAFLNANHYADTCADLAFHLILKDSSNEMIKSACKMQLPYSNLSFSLTCNGKLLDRHVSTHIRDTLSRERIKRLKKKSTQGLLWRIVKYTTSTWKTLSFNAGLFRSLLGMSNTHTRCLYKASPYRMGCILDHISGIHDPEQKQAILSSPINNQVNLVSSCKWCVQKTTNPHKGNRRHMFLNCSDRNLEKFRTRMNNTIGNRFAIFINELQSYSCSEMTESLIRTINQDLRSLQRHQIGRLKLLPQCRNNSYLHIDELLRKLDKSTIMEASTELPQIFFSHVLGLIPEYSNIEQTDEEIGVIDGPWLGLIPSCVDNTAKSCIYKIVCEISDKENAATCKTNLLQSWREVKALILGKEAGIHKIINSTSEQKEAQLVEKHHLKEMVEQEKTRRRKRQLTKHMHSDQQHLVHKKARIEVPTKRCTGLTCSPEKEIWCYRNSFTDNLICLNRKQCQRCAIFSCAMKKTESILQEMVEATENHNLKWRKFIKTIRQTDKHARIQYPSLMDMLKAAIPTSIHFTRAQYIRKNRPTENWKRICRIMIAAINAVEETTKGSTSQEVLRKSMQLIGKVIKEKRIEMEMDSAILKKYITEYQTNTDLTQKTKSSINRKSQNPLPPEIIITSETQNTTSKQTSTIEDADPKQIDGGNKHVPIVIDDSNLDEKEKLPATSISTVTLAPQSTQEIQDLMRVKIDVLNRRSWMSGNQLTMAVDVLRDEHKEHNIFLACTEAASIIDAWEPHNGWRRFARIFRSRIVSHRKPDGIYLIPIFSDGGGSGHWHTIILEKCGNVKKGFVIDSLGTGNINNHITRKITDAFSPGRGTCAWTAPTSVRQQAVECGPRTVCTMETICKGKEIGETIENSIRAATLRDTETDVSYNQTKYRRRAANLIGRYRTRMLTLPIRN